MPDAGYNAARVRTSSQLGVDAEMVIDAIDPKTYAEEDSPSRVKPASTHRLVMREGAADAVPCSIEAASTLVSRGA
jgi:hypothetical protein